MTTFALQALEHDYPWIPWREPMRIRPLDGDADEVRYACRVCAAVDGMSGADYDQLSDSEDEVRLHFAVSHLPAGETAADGHHDPEAPRPLGMEKPACLLCGATEGKMAAYITTKLGVLDAVRCSDAEACGMRQLEQGDRPPPGAIVTRDGELVAVERVNVARLAVIGGVRVVEGVDFRATCGCLLTAGRRLDNNEGTLTLDPCGHHHPHRHDLLERLVDPDAPEVETAQWFALCLDAVNAAAA